MEKTKTILVTAYAVNPYKGSEDGMGWNFINQIARFNQVIAVTRENNRESIEKYMSEHPSGVYSRITFLYFDLPYWMRWWKKGGRGAMLYYWMWQYGMTGFIRKQNVQFDIAHNLNFHNDWTPSYLWKLGKPFVWGPIGHHPFIPKQYLKYYGISALAKDRLSWLVKNMFWHFSWSLKKTVKKADAILCMNSEVAKKLHLKNSQYRIMPSVATENQEITPKRETTTFRLISAGRLVPLKGFDLAIEAFSRYLNENPADTSSELVIVGSGPNKEFLNNLCLKKGIEKQVRFIKWMERKDLLDLYQNASAFLFPSHEGAGMVVAEALSFGLPVICLDNSGPGEFIDDSCGVGVPESSYEQTVEQLAIEISMLHDKPEILAAKSHAARKAFEERFHWDNRGARLASIYNDL